MKKIFTFLLFIYSLIVISQTADTITIKININNLTVDQVNNNLAYYIGQVKWTEHDTNPAFQSKLTDIQTTYQIKTFEFYKDGHFYITEKAYKYLVYPFVSQGDVILKAVAVLDNNPNYSANLKIIFSYE